MSRWPTQLTDDDHLYRCWSGGLGLGQTLIALRRRGSTLSIGDVHAAFVRLAARFSGEPA